MKRLLTMLASVGLTAAAGGAAVSCSTGIKAKDVKVDQEKQIASFTKKLKLTKGTILIVDPKDDSRYVVIPYKLTDGKNTESFMGILMKPESDVKVDQAISLSELNSSLFLVEKNKLTDVVQKQIGTVDETFVLSKDSTVPVQVVMDLSKAFGKDDSELSWTLVDLKQVGEVYQIVKIQDKVNIKLDSPKSDDKTPSDKTPDVTPEPKGDDTKPSNKTPDDKTDITPSKPNEDKPDASKSEATDEDEVG